MAVQNLETPLEQVVAPVNINADFAAKTMAEELSTEQLVQRSGSISVHVNRSFAGRTDYENVKELDSALKEVSRALPDVPSAYKPTGRMNATAAILILLAAPAIFIVLLALCGGLSWGWMKFESLFSAETRGNNSRILGLFSLLVDLVIMVLMVVVPMACYERLSKWSKNRNPVLPAVLTALIDLAVGVLLFVPLWNGESLAPAQLTFVFIPVRWLFVFGGCLLVPVVGALVVATQICGQKFCEQTGHYLERVAEVKIPFDFAENALTLLHRGEYAATARLPRVTEPEAKRKHDGCIVLWWREQAATAFLELDLRFYGKYPIQAGASTSARDKPKKWIGFSVRLNAAQAAILAGQLR